MAYINRERKSQIRHHARMSYVESRTSPFDKCGYCGCDIVWAELLPPRCRIISKSQTELRWRYRGKYHKMAPATVEHIRKIEKGGGNFLENLMGACFECNNKQGRLTEKKISPLRKMKDRGKHLERTPINVSNRIGENK